MQTVINFVRCIVLGGQTLIQTGFAQTELFPNYGKTAWIARILGTDSENTFIREFIERDWDDAQNKGAGGVLCFRNLLMGLYEFRKFAISNNPANCKVSGFILMTESGVIEVSKEVAMKIAKLLDSASWEEIETNVDLVELLGIDLEPDPVVNESQL